MLLRRVVWLVGLALFLQPVSSFADEANRAGLLVVFGDGQYVSRCIAFEGAEISGSDLLMGAGLEMIIDPSTALGIRVCQIEGVGCAYPAEHCFCQCMGGGACAYWNYFYRDPGEPTWTYSALGAALRKVQPGSVEAWVWGDGRTPPSDDLTFEAICSAATATPTAELPTPSATNTPTPAVPISPSSTATAVAEQSAPPTPSSTSRATDPILPSTPGPSSVVEADAELASYWPFGLMVAGLVVVGLLVWLRRG